MKKLFLSLILAMLLPCALGAENTLMLSGRVKEALNKTDLTQARVLLYDSVGNVCDTIRANQGLTYRNMQLDTLSFFYFSVPRVDSTYVFDVICEDYKTATISYDVKNVGRRENYRNIPVIYLERAPRQLKELTVTSTKIKFYNKGDTVVYNAEAFQLAEGSMLDALIAQLPGVELNNDGQIKVNGEFVESLLLNGKEFLDGNNNLMLENIGAYTVKNIEVYEGQKKLAKMQSDMTAPKVLTMDVRLKREYSMGWLINAQGGYGTEDRYMGKLFASWFNATSRVTFLGNLNNLNDNRQPGRNDTWTPEMMPSGTKEYRMAAVNYNSENPEGSRSAQGDFIFRQSVDNRRRTSDRTNFLPGGDTYENSFSNSHTRETALQTNHSYYNRANDKFGFGAGISGSYTHFKNSQSDLSASFNNDPGTITPEILDALYSDGSAELLESVINRAKTRTDGWRKHLNGSFNPYLSFKIPRTGDRLLADFSIRYSSDKEELWRDYDINYGRNTADAVKRRQYLDNAPNHSLGMSGTLRYSTNIANKCYTSLSYTYAFSDNVKDSYMYALDHLADMGVYGVVPGHCLEAFDPDNSYTSRVLENRHTVGLRMNYYEEIGSNSMLAVNFNPNLAFVHRKLDYWRANRSYGLSTDNTTLTLSTIWDAMVEYYFGRKGEGRERRYRNAIRYSYRISPTLPDMVDMVDVVNDADPLNIYLGNPDLKVQNAHRHLMRWSYTPHSHTFTNILYLGFNHTDNALTRGYTYDTSTGVRYNRMYNVSGNTMKAVTNELRWQFGATKQFTLSSESDFNLSTYSDMIGVNMEEPEHTKVKHRSMSEKMKFMWQFVAHSLQVRCDLTNRHTTSTQPDFDNLNANHLNYGISGLFKLPAGFAINTDFTCYTRRGYGVDYLDTTDPVWNARLSYCPPRNSRWVFMIDGFDLLHKLSNVNYAVTANGRTVSYTNALPRYILFSFQYRLNIQPKKR